MADPTLFERPYTGAYDHAVTEYLAAHPEPGPTYAELKKRLFSEPESAAVDAPVRPAPYRAPSSLEPMSGSGLALGLALGVALYG